MCCHAAVVAHHFYYLISPGDARVEARQQDSRLPCMSFAAMVFNMLMLDMLDMLSSSCQVLDRYVLLVVDLVASLTIYLPIMTPLASGSKTLGLSAHPPTAKSSSLNILHSSLQFGA